MLYVGAQGESAQWAPNWLPGRMLSTTEAVAAMVAAEALRRDSAEAPQWAKLQEDVIKPLGLSLIELAGYLDLNYTPPAELQKDTPSVRRKFWLPGGRR